LIAKCDENPSATALHFAIENGVEDRIAALNVLNQQGGAEAKGRLEILPEKDCVSNWKTTD